MGAIQYVVEGLRELPGRKSVILFSEHMKINYQDGLSQRVMDSIKRLTDAANRSSVVIYTIDPRGLVYAGLTAADDTRGRNPKQLSQIPMQRSQQMWESQDGLVMLADTRTNAGIDNLATFRKLRNLGTDGRSVIAVASAGSLSTTQIAIGRAIEGFVIPASGMAESLAEASRIHRAAFILATHLAFTETWNRLAMGILKP